MGGQHPDQATGKRKKWRDFGMERQAFGYGQNERYVKKYGTDASIILSKHSYLPVYVSQTANKNHIFSDID